MIEIVLIVCFLPSLFCGEFFTAGVFEQQKIHDDINGVVISLDTYENISAQAAAKGVDVIVFPEYGVLPMTANRTLTRQFAETIPDPQKTTNWIPCLQRPPNNPILTRLSCMARKNRIIVVANIADQQPCNANDTCRPDGVHVFNTNVAFNKNGTLVARYHKRFLFDEDAFDRPEKPNYVTFDTEYGRFGLITCFDIMFNESIQLIEKYNVDTIIAPVFWNDLLPVGVSVQMFNGWAVTQRVNVLLANIQNLNTATMGSGIFAWSMETLNYTHEVDDQGALITGMLPKSRHFLPNTCINASKTDDYRLSSKDSYENSSSYSLALAIDNMSNYTTVLLSNNVGNLSACNNGLCCNLTYNSSLLNERYYLAAHRGIHGFERYAWYEEVCTVFKWHTGTFKELTFTNEPNMYNYILLDTNAAFHKLHLQGNFSTKYIYPSVVVPRLTLMPYEHWNFSIRNNISDLYIKAEYPLLSASLFGRVYSKDPEYHP